MRWLVDQMRKEYNFSKAKINPYASGLKRQVTSRWTRVVCGVVCILLLLYTLSYFLMVGLEFGAVWYVINWIAAIFSAYTLGKILRYR